jgi:hypothetical protein
MTNRQLRKTRKQRKSRKTRKSRKIGGYKQYLSNVGFSNGYQLGFDPTMNTPSAIRTASNWVKN